MASLAAAAATISEIANNRPKGGSMIVKPASTPVLIKRRANGVVPSDDHTTHNHSNGTNGTNGTNGITSTSPPASAGINIAEARADSIVLHRKQTSERLERWLSTNQRPSKDQLADRNILHKEPDDQKLDKRKRSSLLSKLLKARGKKSYFGVALGELSLDETEKIPKIVVQLTMYLRNNAINLEGVFRISGATREVLEMRKRLDKDYDSGQIDLSDCTKPHTIATLFKQFFSQLPEPLFTFDLYNDFIQCLNDDPRITITAMRGLFCKLPPINFRTAQYLFKFLHDVGTNVSQNKMTSSNLALIFAPNILRPQTQTNTNVFDTKNCRIAEILIERYNDVFGNQWIKASK
eukprot:TRINITY_DN1989_c1_g2_i2.p1 TRINITY_DN1989_c1_g2~~TRINITY_DN1989_c1_g2_i2.p1  ORF type:complete len:350 (+),score=70.14 TRINITY_DN1989_c1_g2_i2:754-1803(+)